MEKASVLLFMAALICLILGLIKPSLFKGLFKAKTSRKVVGITFGLIMVASFIVFGAVSKPLTEEEKAKAEIDLAIKESDKEEEVKKKEAKAKPTVAPADAIKNIIQEELDGKNNNHKAYLRDINLAMDNNEASVIISYNADENLTTNMTLTGIKGKMGELYTKLYKNHLPIKSVSVCAYMTLSDKYGNNSDDIVYTTVLSKEEAAKVNWSTDDAVLKYTILPKVWTDTYLHPALTADE